MAKNPLQALLKDKEKKAQQSGQGKVAPESIEDSPSAEPEAVEHVPVRSETAAMVERSMDSMRDPDAFILPTSAIVIPALLLRDLNQEHAEETGESMRVNGQDTPIVVEQLADGHWQLVAGLHRLSGKNIMSELYPMELEHRQIRAVRKGSSSALLTAYRENASRLNFTAGEEAGALVLLLDELQCNQTELAVKVNKSKGHVSKLLALHEAPDDIKHAIDSGVLSLGRWYDNRGKSLAELLGGSLAPALAGEEEEEGEDQGEAKAAPAPKKKKTTEQRIAVPLSTAKNLAAMLAHLAELHDLPAIEIKSRATKADIQAVITMRGDEIADAVIGGNGDQ